MQNQIKWKSFVGQIIQVARRKIKDRAEDWQNPDRVTKITSAHVICRDVKDGSVVHYDRKDFRVALAEGRVRVMKEGKAA